MLIRDGVVAGVRTWKGPTKYSQIWFDGFQSNGRYDIAAIAKRSDSQYFFPILNSFSDILFAFDDGVRTLKYSNKLIKL